MFVQLKSEKIMFHLELVWEVAQNYGLLLVCFLSGFLVLCCGFLNNTSRRLQFIDFLSNHNDHCRGNLRFDKVLR